jgi:hypothetical protein
VLGVDIEMITFGAAQYLRVVPQRVGQRQHAPSLHIEREDELLDRRLVDCHRVGRSSPVTALILVPNIFGKLTGVFGISLLLWAFVVVLDTPF